VPTYARGSKKLLLKTFNREILDSKSFNRNIAINKYTQKWA